MKMTCEKCGIEYEGHHRSKRCDACKGTAESFAKDVGDWKDRQERAAVIDAYAESLGSDMTIKATTGEDVEKMTHGMTTASQFEEMVNATYSSTGLSIDTVVVPWWSRYGMCDGGYEVWPGWVWSQKKLVCVKGDAPKEVLEWLQDAIQRPVVNRRPILGDFDYEVKK